MSTERKESKFMKWGQQYEAILAHFVAWTLMCATEDGKREYGEKLSNYSKEILFFLLFGKDNQHEKSISVESVKIWREWKRIDVLTEITLTNNKKYALFIELKSYSHTNKKQLESYKEACEMYDYKSKGFEEKFVLLGAWEDDCPDFDKKCCDDAGFTICTFQDIVENVFLKGEQTFESSDNKLFDEFWTGIW